MKSVVLKFSTPKFYDLYNTCHAHGWKNLSPFEWRTDRLSFALLAGKTPVDVEVKQLKNTLRASISSNRLLTKPALAELIKKLRRTLDLDVDTTALHEIASVVGEQYADLVVQGCGRRLCSATLWEDAAKTLFTTNCSWALTKKMCAAACSEHFTKPAPSGRFPFPAPDSFATKTPAELKVLMTVGYRAPYLHELAQRFVSDPALGGVENASRTDAFSTVNDLLGFGDYATNHLLMMAGHFQQVPVDSVVAGFVLKAHGAKEPTSFVRKHYAAWGQYQFWGFKLDQIVHRKNWLGD